MKNKINIPLQTISEMEDKIEIPTSIDTEKLIEEVGDKEPMFVTVEAVNPQISRNGWNWTPELMGNIAEQVMESKPDAYQGHLKEEDRAHKTPDAKTIWIGAAVKETKGKKRLFIKGYVLPYAKKLKQYLKASRALGKKVGVSVYGKAKQKWNDKIGAFDLMDFSLESIDWARPGAEGIRTDTPMVLAAEMENNKLNEMEKRIKEMEQEKNMEIKKSKEKEKQIKEMIDIYLENKIREEVKNPTIKNVIKKLVISEMKEKTKDEVDRAVGIIMESEGKKLLQETRQTFSVNPATSKRSSSGRRFTSV